MRQPSRGFDALMPAQMAQKAEDIGVAKAQMPAMTMFVLGVLAGAFIALGAVFSTVVATGSPGALSFGVTRLLTGVAFGLGLVLVVVGGAELFTGNNLIVMAWAGGRIAGTALLRNWVLVYFGNFAGALGIAVLVFAADHHGMFGGEVGKTALSIADGKCRLGFVSAVSLGVLCNVLVCLAVWISFSARSTADRILAVIPPVAAFVACGFEHCVANMYFVPFALMVKSSADHATNYEFLTWSNFLVSNLLPVTLGNILGGTGLVGLTYWFVYLRGRAST